MVFPKSRDAVTTPKSVERFGSLPGQLNPLVLFHMPVVGLSDSAIEVTARLERADAAPFAARYFPELQIAWQASERLLAAAREAMTNAEPGEP